MRKMLHVRARLVAASLLSAIAVGGTSMTAQRGATPSTRASAPTGGEIAAAARAGRLDHGNAGSATLFGKPFKFTPVQLPTEKDPPDDGKGQFVGVLENNAPGDETGLPVGKYNLFLANVAGQWKCYAEANGQIVREAIRTTAAAAQPGAKAPPRFTEKGWCVTYYYCTPRGIWPDGAVRLECRWFTVCY